MGSNQELRRLLHTCTVRLEVGRQHGTGFFVASGTILTCEHVVKPALKDALSVRVFYDSQVFDSQPILASEKFLDDYPDLAILRLEFTDHPCVFLGRDFEAFINLYSYGYTIDHPEGESTTVKCEGELGKLIKLKEGQVKPGSSGSPLLNEETGFVCGVIKMTRDRATDLGGGGIPVATVFQCFLDLEKQNQTFHRHDTRWLSLVEKGREARTSNVVTAHLYTNSKQIQPPKYWVERDDLLPQINNLLGQANQVLLTGMGGIGKTALAQVLVIRRLQGGGTPVIWIEVGDERSDVLIEALAECCGDEKIFSLPNINEKKQKLRKLLQGHEAGLMIFDNVNNINAVNDLLDAVPDKLPVLLTSRWRFAVDEIVNVNQLSPKQALTLLGQAAGKKDFSSDMDAAFLCELFGYHPLALEIVGASMKERSNVKTPKAFRKRFENDPLRLSSLREGEIRPLLDDSVEDLPEILKTVFFAFGKFPSNGLTPTLLTLYLDRPEDEVLNDLDALVVRNLLKYREETEFYFLHDLVFHYVQTVSRPDEEERKRVIDAVIGYLKDNWHNFDLLALDMSNVLMIAGKCEAIQLIEIMSWLTVGGYPTPGPDSYFENKGHPLALLKRLDQAIRACREMDDCPDENLHYLLGKRGNAYFNLGDYENAISCYEEAIALAPNKDRQATLTSVAGRTYAFRGDRQKSKEYFQLSYKIAEELNDDLLLILIMGQESHTASFFKDFKKVHNIAEKQVVTARRIVDTAPSPLAYKHLFFALLNLGTAEMDLSKQGNGSFETALPILIQAKQVALDQKNDVLLAYAFDSLGENYHYLKKRTDAQASFEQALLLWNKLGMINFHKELEERIQSLGYSVPE